MMMINRISFIELKKKFIHQLLKIGSMKQAC